MRAWIVQAHCPTTGYIRARAGVADATDGIPADVPPRAAGIGERTVGQGRGSRVRHWVLSANGDVLDWGRV